MRTRRADPHRTRLHGRWMLAVISILLVATTQTGTAADPGCPGIHRTITVDGPSSLGGGIVVGDTLVLADGRHGITTWDVTDPDHPVHVGTFDLPAGRFSSFSSVKMRADENGTIYVSTEYSRLWAFDVADPGDPRPVWRSDLWPQPPDVRDFDVRGTTLAIAGMPVQVFDVSDSSEPVLMAEVGFVGFAVALTDGHIVSNNSLFGGLDVYGFDGVTPPEFLERVDLGEADPQAALWGTDDLVFIASSSLPAVVDLSSGIEYSPLVNSLGWNVPRGLTFDGRMAYAAVSYWQSGARLEVLDFTAPSRPALVNMAPLSGLPVLGDERLFVIDRHEFSVHRLQAGLPTSGGIGPSGVAEKLLFDDDLGILGDGPAGVVTYDFADPDAPVELGRVDVGGWVDDIAVADGYAFLAADDAGFVVVDYKDPDEPTAVWQTAFPNADDIALAGNLALVASGSRQPYGNAWLEIFDVSDPRSPQHLGAVAGYQEPGNTTVAVSNGIVYFGSGDHVLVVDLANPAAPEILSTVRLINTEWQSGSIGDLAISGTYLLAACHSFGLIVVDVSDPSTPFVETSIDRYSSIVSVADGGVYADLDGRVAAIDLDDPGGPSWRPFRNLRGMWAITPWRDRLYLASPPYVEILSLGCEPPQAAFEWQALGRMVWFTNTSRSWWEEIEWNMGDGAVVDGERNPMHLYQTDGTYDVTVQVSSETGSSQVTHSVTVTGSGSSQPGSSGEEVTR